MEEREILYNVYSLKMAKYILKLGFELVSTKQCEENPARTIFRFHDTPELRKAANEYSEACKKYFGTEQ